MFEQLESAAEEAPHAPAIITHDSVVSYVELLQRARRREARTVFAAAPTLETLEEIHAAILHRQPIAPLHPLAPVSAHAALADRLVSIAIAPTTLAVLSTSGSTGVPKLVELSAAAFLAHATASNAHLELDVSDRWLLALPLAHTGGLSIVMRTLLARAAVVLAPLPPLGPRFATGVIETVCALGVTRLSLVPAQLQQLVESDRPAPSALRSALIGGQAIPAKLATRALELGWPIMSSYGLTETCGVCVASRVGEVLPGAVGRALPGTRLRIEDGLLEISGPAVASRVWGNASSITDDGWLRTADRATIEGGRVTILGRADDVIISAGHKIDPLEIEAALLTLPMVRAAVVVGVVDEKFGSRIVALVNATADLEADALEDLLPRYKQPREFHRVDSLPLLGSGKVDRLAARRLAEAMRVRPR